MNYLLLMYHPESYWQSASAERDALEEEAFAEFCAWMKGQNIRWTSNALEAPSANQRLRFSDVTNQLLPEITEVISGYFLLDIPETVDLDALLARVPRIESSGVELRRIM